MKKILEALKKTLKKRENTSISSPDSRLRCSCIVYKAEIEGGGAAIIKILQIVGLDFVDELDTNCTVQTVKNNLGHEKY
jgi:hypothetical protein